jgi:hypothetical protein
MGDTVTASIADDFENSKQGSLWKLNGDDLSNCWLERVNHRLELRATTKTRTTSAYYVSNGWRIDPTHDFSFKIDFHYGLHTDPTGWLFVGLTPDANDLSAHHVQFGPGCSKSYPHVSFEVIDAGRMQTDVADRRQDDGVLYVSYDAKVDTLYLSTTGYGAGNAWRAVPGLLLGSWADRPLWLYLGGESDGQEIQSSDAYLDNFIIDSGGPVTPPLSEVDRFWSPVLQRHFYTIDPSERDKLTKEYSKIWTPEGPVFKAAVAPYGSGLAPVYRFWSLQGQGHFYTIDEGERSALTGKYSAIWVFEGVAFYAYPEGAQPPGSKPVYRFLRPKDNSHFYTIDANESDWLIKHYSKVYTFEGLAFYAFE